MNGLAYEVEVEEIGTSDALAAPPQATAPAAQAPRKAPPAAAVAARPEPERGKEHPKAPPTTDGATMISSPLPGAVLDVKVAMGQVVQAGQVVAVLEAMKMENEILSPCGGTVRAVHVRPGSAVSLGDPLIEVG